jgi:hypothetical protein
MDDLRALKDDEVLRRVLIADGATDNLPVSGWAASDWSDGKDPDWSETYGGADTLYIPPAVIQDGEGL